LITSEHVSVAFSQNAYEPKFAHVKRLKDFDKRMRKSKSYPDLGSICSRCKVRD